MTRTVELGAPSLTGKDANDLVAEVFADAAYPLKVVVQNHMPQDVVFPEVEGLFLRHVANPKDSRKTVVIADHDLFQRLASSVEQIAAWLDHLTEEEVLERMSRLQMTHTYDPDIVLRNFEVLKGMRDEAVAFGAEETAGD